MASATSPAGGRKKSPATANRASGSRQPLHAEPAAYRARSSRAAGAAAGVYASWMSLK